MPMIHCLFGGSSRDDVISFSSLNTRDILDGLFPTSRKDPRKEMPPFAQSRIRSEETTEHHIYKADLHGLGIDGLKLKVEEAGFLQVCGEQRIPKGKEQSSHGGGRSSSRFRHRILLPDDAEVEKARAAIRKGVLMITMPRKTTQKPDSEAELNRPPHP